MKQISVTFVIVFGVCVCKLALGSISMCVSKCVDNIDHTDCYLTNLSVSFSGISLML